MNRLTRCLSLSLLFATLGASAVAVFGEPVENTPAYDIAEATEAEAIEGLSTELPGVEPAATGKEAAAASRMRWMITLPGARNRNCCRPPV